MQGQKSNTAQPSTGKEGANTKKKNKSNIGGGGGGGPRKQPTQTKGESTKASQQQNEGKPADKATPKPNPKPAPSGANGAKKPTLPTTDSMKKQPSQKPNTANYNKNAQFKKKPVDYKMKASRDSGAKSDSPPLQDPVQQHHKKQHNNTIASAIPQEEMLNRDLKASRVDVVNGQEEKIRYKITTTTVVERLDELGLVDSKEPSPPPKGNPPPPNPPPTQTSPAPPLGPVPPNFPLGYAGFPPHPPHPPYHFPPHPMGFPFAPPFPPFLQPIPTNNINNNAAKQGDKEKVKKKNVKCTHFERGKCLKPDCKFSHPPRCQFHPRCTNGDNCPLLHVPVCTFYQKGRCTNSDCPFLHLKDDPKFGPKQKKQKEKKTKTTFLGDPSKTKCKRFEQGLCTAKGCPFLHPSQECRRFPHCNRGMACNFLHIFDEHLLQDEINRGIALETIKEGVFKAIVQVDDEEWLVTGRYANRAVHGDIVALQLLDAPSDTSSSDSEDDDSAIDSEEPKRLRHAKVVGIVKRCWRPYCGVLLDSSMKDRNRVEVAQKKEASGSLRVFCPMARSIPNISVDVSDRDDLDGKRLVVSMSVWPRTSRFPLGELVKVVGPLGDRDVENEVLRLEMGIPHYPFSESVLRCLPETWKAKCTGSRVDFRHQRVFSIDPKDSMDIDDAFHIEELPNGLFEVGVHIADVSHFVKPDSALDREASNRGRSVYMNDVTIEMLPEQLSHNLCSLKKGVDRYAVSVVFRMTAYAEVLAVSFYRSLINSAASYTYEQAQKIIDDPNSPSQLARSIKQLAEFGKILSKNRRDRGSIVFVGESRFDDWSIEKKQLLLSHSLVEELMILTNVAVATKLKESLPQRALLRSHSIGEKQAEYIKRLLDVMNGYKSRCSAEEMDMLFRTLTSHLPPATYFTAGTVPEEKYGHAGLAIPLYTHFTSPIRRYVDIIVHRLLLSTMGAEDEGPCSQSEVEKIAYDANKRHQQSLHISRSSKSFLLIEYFRENDGVETGGMISAIEEKYIKVFLSSFGHESSISTYVLPGVVTDVATRTVDWKGRILREMDEVRVIVRVDDTNIQVPRLAVHIL